LKKQKITIKDFAEKLGVSTATVSRALNDTGRISEKTRKFIKEKANELGFRANIYASQFRTRQSNVIGFFFPVAESGDPGYFISEIMSEVSDEAVKTGKILQIYPVDESGENIESFKNGILNGSLAGIIVVAGSKTSSELVLTAKDAGVPYMIIGGIKSETENCVIFDNENGARLAGKYFLNTGRKKPVYVGGYLDTRKKRGFKEGLGILANELIFDDGGCSFNQGYQAFERIFSKLPETDCALCANDVLAIGFIKAAAAKGFRVPQDVAVIGFDDVKISRFYSPALTTVALNQQEAGKNAFRKLMRLIAGEKTMANEKMASDLILRDST